MKVPNLRKRSYCDADFLIKLHQTLAKAEDHENPTKKRRLTPNPQNLLSYGTDVNISHSTTRSTPNLSPHSTTLIVCAGDVNCDSEHLHQTPLHAVDAVRVRNTDATAKLLANEGAGINCPLLPGSCDPLLLDEAIHRFTIATALVTFGTDTNRVQGHWNLQFLANFLQFQQGHLEQSVQTEGGQGLVLNALLSSGSEVNSVPFKGRSVQNCCFSKKKTDFGRMADLLVTYGHKVNSICD